MCILGFYYIVLKIPQCMDLKYVELWADSVRDRRDNRRIEDIA